MRNEDNYIDAHDFVMTQLAPYDYSDPDHLHVLKLKVWALDGPLTSADGSLVDDDVLDPVDHYNSLMNELTFVDRYYRTVVDELEEDESTYSELVRERNESMQDFLTTARDDGTFPEDWEMPYRQRPLLMSDAQVAELADVVAGKVLADEIYGAFELVTKPTSDNIDVLTAQQDMAIEMSMTPSQTEASALAAGLAELAREDRDNVIEMNNAHDEIVSIVSSYAPPAPAGPAEDIVDPEWDGVGDEADNMIPNPIQWEDSKVVIVNFPTRREQVSEVKNHPSHKGMINDVMSTGGYRFVYRLAGSLSPVVLDRANMVSSISPDKYNQVEWDHSAWLYAHYYVESDSDTGLSTPYLKPLGVTASSLSASDRARHDELDRRWKNINRLREDIMSQSGHRARIESMIDLEAIDIRPDMIDHRDDRIEHKRNTTEITKERCLFGEYS